MRKQKAGARRAIPASRTLLQDRLTVIGSGPLAETRRAFFVSGDDALFKFARVR
jgi:hypothetical protein